MNNTVENTNNKMKKRPSFKNFSSTKLLRNTKPEEETNSTSNINSLPSSQNNSPKNSFIINTNNNNNLKNYSFKWSSYEKYFEKTVIVTPLINSIEKKINSTTITEKNSVIESVDVNNNQQMVDNEGDSIKNVTKKRRGTISELNSGSEINSDINLLNQITILSSSIPLLILSPISVISISSFLKNFIENIDWSEKNYSFYFPNDDIIIFKIENESKINSSAVLGYLENNQSIEENSNKKTFSYISSFISLYTQPWRVIEFVYQNNFGNKTKNSNLHATNATIITTKDNDSLISENNLTPPTSPNNQKLTEDKKIESLSPIPQTNVETSDSSTTQNDMNLISSFSSPNIAKEVKIPTTPSTPNILQSNSNISSPNKNPIYQLDPSLINTNSKDSIRKTSIAKQIKNNHGKLFQHFPVNEKELNPPVINPAKILQQKLPDIQFIISDNPQMNDNEPSFFIFSLHDVRKRKKISEDWSIMSGDPILRNPLFGIYSSINTELKDIFLFVRVLKIYKIGHDTQPSKYKPKKSSSLESFNSQNNNPNINASNLSSDHQLSFVQYAWGFIQLFDNNKKFLGSVQNPLLEKKEGMKGGFQTRRFSTDLKLIKPGSSITDDYIYDSIINEAHVIKKLKTVNELLINIRQVSKNNPSLTLNKGRRINPSSFSVKSSQDNSKENVASSEQSVIIQEIETFEEGEPYPYLSYVNNIYIYPKNLQIKSSGETNIQIRVDLRETDNTNIKLDHLNNFYSKYSTRLTDCYYSVIIPNNKTPEFCDEIKIRLPTRLNEKLHLLFTFHNVSTKNGIKIPLGYSVLPLFKDNQIIADCLHSIPVSKSKSLEPNYLNYYYNSPEKWSETKKFQVKVKVKSTVYSSDRNLTRFFQDYWKPAPEGINAMQSLKLVDNDTIISFLPHIFNLLFEVLANDTKKKTEKQEEETSNTSQMAFLTIVSLLNRLTNQNQQSLLHSYIYHIFDNTKEKKPAFYQIFKYWFKILTDPKYENQPNNPLREFKTYWFFFDIIIKSMILYLYDNKAFDQPKNQLFLRRKQYPKKFRKKFPKLIEMLLLEHYNQQSLNYDVIVSFPLFLCKLFPLFNRGTLFKIIFEYFLKMGNEDKSVIKFFWLKIICDYEHYIPLNIPKAVFLESKSEENKNIEFMENLTDLSVEFWRNHFLVGLLLNEVNLALNQNSILRDQAIICFRNILRKHCFDVRYNQSPKTRHIIGTLYFPFINIIVDNLEKIKNMSEEETQKWILCFLYIISNTKHKLIINFLKKNTFKGRDSFLQVLHYCTILFMDKNRVTEVNFIILDIILEFVDFFENLLNEEDSSSKMMITRIFEILKQLLKSQSEYFVSHLYSTLSLLIIKLQKFIFSVHGSLYCHDLLYEILRHCNVTNTVIRTKASSLLYLLMKTNYLECNENISRIRHFAIVSQSKFVGSEKKKNYNHLIGSLEAISQYAKMESNSDNLSIKFYQQIEEIIGRLIDITKYEKRIALNWGDEESTADIYISISNDYMDSPDLRLTWLENLALIHVQNGNIEEAAQCKIHIAFLITCYLQRKNPNVLPNQLRTIASQSLPKEFFKKKNSEPIISPFLLISPSILTELQFSEEIYQDSSRFQSDTWSLKALTEHLKDAITFLKRERRFEICERIYSLLWHIYSYNKNYEELVKWAEQYKELCQELLNEIADTKQIFSRYYRVTFYIPRKYQEQIISPLSIEDDQFFDIRTYIYKKKYKLTIGSVTQLLIKQLAHRYHKEEKDIISLPNKDIDISTLLPDKIYFQIVTVQPYFDANEAQQRITLFEQNFDLGQFISEIPFMSDGGKFNEDDVGRQQKKKTIFTTYKSFPYLNNRSEVMSLNHIILTPIECAVEAMQQRVNLFKCEVNCKPARKNNLQGLLTGTLATTVHVGPLKFCEVFLNDPNNCYPTKFKTQLRNLMAELLVLAKELLKINNEIIGREQLSFHNMLENKFQQTLTTFKENYVGNLNWDEFSNQILSNIKK